jgi:DNA-binding beta-propeller fold protein YncE
MSTALARIDMSIRSALALATIAVLTSGCLSTQALHNCQWETEQLQVIGGLEAPECAFVNPADGKVYASNMTPDEKDEGDTKYWGDDGTGSISLLSDSKLEKLHWAESSDTVTFDSPKGICILNSQLWIADNHQVVVVDIATGKPVKALEVPDAKFLNDMVSDGEYAYAADTATSRISRVGPGVMQHYKGPASANGLAFRDEKLYCSSWGEHEIFEIDLSGKEEAKPVGLAKKFANLDGIEALPDGSFIVSDQPNNRIVWVSADFKKTKTIAKVNAPADFGIDIKRERLYVPCFTDSTVTVFSLRRK